ncbi:hypothetical protein D3C81_2244670 [compost metagenome]
MQPRLVGQLFAVAPVLYFPYAAGGDQQQHQNARQRQFQRGWAHGTSLKNTWRPSLNVSLAPFTQVGGFGIVVE